jgi:glutamate transport system permease protein
MTGAPVLGDAPGPRARRRATIASVLAGTALTLATLLALNRLARAGQLDPGKWTLLASPGVVRFLLGGLANTVRAAFVALLLAGALGTALALGRLSRALAVRLLAGGYVELFRSFPLLILIIFAFLGLPKLGVNLSRYWALVLALTAYNGALLGEIFRAGILSLDRGQGEAASALGLRHRQAMRLVILPQAFRRMIPTIASQVVTLLKDTSLGYALGYEELLRRGQIAGEFGKNTLQALSVVAVIYVCVNLTLSRLARRLEIQQRRRYRAGAISVAGAEDLVAVAVAADAQQVA